MYAHQTDGHTPTPRLMDVHPHIRQLEVHPKSPAYYQTDSYTPTISNISDWWLHNSKYQTDRSTTTKPNISDCQTYTHNAQHIRLLGIQPKYQSDGHTPTKPNISDWWKYIHISNCWTYIHKAYQTDGGTATKTNTSDWQTYIDKNPAYQTDRYTHIAESIIYKCRSWSSSSWQGQNEPYIIVWEFAASWTVYVGHVVCDNVIYIPFVLMSALYLRFGCHNVYEFLNCLSWISRRNFRKWTWLPFCLTLSQM